MTEGLLLNGRYQLLEKVGSGGMATVYKALDNALGRNVAIKVMHQSLTSDEAFLQRFTQEAHAAANLTHPNIVTVHDIGQDGQRHYIVMEFVEGRTLKELVRMHNKNGQLMPIKRTLDLIIQVCNGIGYAHRANLVHCDVKPQNILVTLDDRVKVADFGIARAMSRVNQPLEPDGQVWGTPQYFAPEQAAGKPATPAADVYAIGVVLFEMLGGRTPFQADTPTAVALQHMHTRPPLVSQLNPAVPTQLEQILQKVLSKEPSGRYRTAGQFGRILTTYRQRSRAETGPLWTTPAAQPPSAGTYAAQPPEEQDNDSATGSSRAVSQDSQQSTAARQRSVPAVPNAELKTQIHQNVPAGDKTAIRQTVPEQRSTPAREQRQLPVRDNKVASPVATVHITAPQGSEDDEWRTIALGLTALVSLLGLIPLWYFVYRAWGG